MRTLNKVVLACGLALLLGCGDDEEEKKPGKANDANAKSNGQQQTTAIFAAMDGNGSSAADNLYSAGTSSQGTVTAQSFSPELSIQTLHPLADGPGCSCSGKTCTFTNCERGGQGQVKLNGTMSAENGAFKCDLTWEVDGSGSMTGLSSMTKVHVKADMTVTDTSIKGTFHTDGSVQLKGVSLPSGVPGGTGNVSWTNDATWDVTVANKKPSAGTITYSGTYTSGGSTYTGDGKVSYP